MSSKTSLSTEPSTELSTEPSLTTEPATKLSTETSAHSAAKSMVTVVAETWEKTTGRESWVRQGREVLLQRAKHGFELVRAVALKASSKGTAGGHRSTSREGERWLVTAATKMTQKATSWLGQRREASTEASLSGARGRTSGTSFSASARRTRPVAVWRRG